jgi:hypothetical protein
MSRYNKRYLKGIITRRSKEIKIKPENKHPVLIIKNRLKYKVEIENKGYRYPKMTRHAKITSCLDIINDI